MARCLWYTNAVAEDEPDIQRKGVVTILDITDAWKFSTLQALHFLSTYHTESTPFHDVCLHILYNHATIDAVIRRFRRILDNDHRMRIRLHFGLTVETEYSLRTFGLDVSRHLFPPKDGSILTRFDGIEESIQKRQQLDEEWRLSEAPYRDPSSPVARFPNPQDILMGRNKSVLLTWSGNTRYYEVVEQHAHRYGALQCAATDRIEKTMISMELLLLFRTQYNARFLKREENGWARVDDLEVQKKISGALRNSAKSLSSRT